jgi:hypothetical protein
MMPSFNVHPLQLPAGRDLSGAHTTKALLGTTDYSKTYPLVITTSPTLDMIDFLATLGFLLLKSNKEYVLKFQDFNTSSSWLFFFMLAINCKQSCAIQLIKHKYSSTFIIRDLMASGVNSLR